MKKKQQTSVKQLQDFLLSTSQGRSYVVIGATLLLSMIALFGVVLPAIGATISQLTENADRSEFLTKISEHYSNVEQLAAAENQKQSTISRFYQVFPESHDQAALIDQIDALAEQSQVLVNNINFSEKDQKRNLSQLYKVSPKVRAYNMNLSAEGRLQSLTDFVSAVEQSRLIVNVRNLTLQPEEDRAATDEPVFILNLQGEYYFWDSNIVQNPLAQ